MTCSDVIVFIRIETVQVWSANQVYPSKIPTHTYFAELNGRGQRISNDKQGYALTKSLRSKHQVSSLFKVAYSPCQLNF